MKKIYFSSLLITGLSFGSGIVFKLLYFPGGNELFILSLIVFGFVSSPMLLLDTLKKRSILKRSEKFSGYFGFTGGFLLGLSTIFKIYHLPGAKILLIFGSILLIAVFLPILLYGQYKASSMFEN